MERARFGIRLRAGMSQRLIFGFCVLTLLTMLTFVASIGTLMRQRMYLGTDLALRSQARILQSALQNEEDFLSAEALTIANIEGIGEALATKDAAQLRRLLVPVIHSQDVDSVYVIDEGRRVLFSFGEPVADESSLENLSLVSRGFDVLVSSSPFEFRGTLWLGAVGRSPFTRAHP